MSAIGGHVYVATCTNCGHKQATMVPWKHVPICKKCGKAAMQ